MGNRTRRKAPHSIAGRALVFAREHDREHARRLALVGRIFAAGFHGGVVVVDLPEAGLAGEFETAEVMLAVGIVIGREGIEGL